jgi:hemerythrin HHE cation binding domain-containing protein
LPAAMEELRSKLVLEHEALRGLTAQLACDLRAQDDQASTATLNALVQRFRRCVREREEQLLSRLEQLTGVAALTRAAAMRSEQRVILDLLAGIELAVGRGDLLVAEVDLRELSVALELHMKKEDGITSLLSGGLAEASVA